MGAANMSLKLGLSIYPRLPWDLGRLQEHHSVTTDG